jgi:HD-GYP domain-containing protein (c-di-GMP phosphodiesterase class II)
MSIFRINLHQAIYSLSDALDLVGVTHIHHGKRVAYIAAECAKQAGWASDRLNALFQAAILHDCGVSKTLVHARLAQFEWENEAEHCSRGAELLQECDLLQPLAGLVQYHHTHWDELQTLDLPESLKLSANCIYMADRIDISCLTVRGATANLLLSKDHIRKLIADRRGTWFAPELVDVFLEVSHSEAFWFALENEHVSGYVAKWMSESHALDIDFRALRNLVQVFSRIVDAKSTFTREHSDGVACLAHYLGELMGLSERTCEMLELAGLLHDLGKLRVPDELLEKNAKLTAEEYADVKRHSFDTFSILKNIHGLEEVALWAGQHHERVDGSGYPYQRKQGQISLESRIVAVADVFQALAQTRPYRGPLAPPAILAILKDEAARGRLDDNVVAKIEAHLMECYRASLPK